MRKEYRIRIEDQLIELNSEEEYTELKNQYTNYKFMVDKQTLDISTVKTKKQPHIPKPPQWFVYWSENKFEPLVGKVNDIETRLQRVETRLETVITLNNLKTS